MKKLAPIALLSSLFCLAGVTHAGKVSGSANIELGGGDLSISVGSDKGGKAGGANVPPGHMPPPGQCRIWYHGRKPGNQPPPGKCKKLRKKVPSGASLIRG